jgi:hypothetical protein
MDYLGCWAGPQGPISGPTGWVSHHTDFATHLMLYRPPEPALRCTTSCQDEEPTAPGRNQPEGGMKGPAAGSLGDNDPEAPDSGRSQARPGPTRNKPNLPSYTYIRDSFPRRRRSDRKRRVSISAVREAVMNGRG